MRLVSLSILSYRQLECVRVSAGWELTEESSGIIHFWYENRDANHAVYAWGQDNSALPRQTYHCTPYQAFEVRRDNAGVRHSCWNLITGDLLRQPGPTTAHDHCHPQTDQKPSSPQILYCGWPPDPAANNRTDKLSWLGSHVFGFPRTAPRSGDPLQCGE